MGENTQDILPYLGKGKKWIEKRLIHGKSDSITGRRD